MHDSTYGYNCSSVYIIMFIVHQANIIAHSNAYINLKAGFTTMYSILYYKGLCG